MSRDAGTRREIFNGRVIRVGIETVEFPNGDRIELEIVRHPGGAAVVALDDRGRICLLRQWRHAGGGWLWELPAGKLDPGEGPEATAKRELEEEAGVRAERWRSLGFMNSSPGVFDEVIHLYMAEGLSETALAHERGELIEIHWIDLAEVIDWCNRGQISDAKTLIGLYRCWHLCFSGVDSGSKD